MNRFVRFALPPLLVAGAIFVLSSQSDVGPPDFVGADKLAHAAAFGTLAFFSARGFAGYGRPRLQSAVLGALTSVAYGLSDELHQSFVPGRFSDALDLVADATGAVLAAWGWHRWGSPR